MKKSRRTASTSPAARITAAIIEKLEQGTKPWVKPWRGVPVSRPLRSCGTPYRGMNTFWLWMVADGRLHFKFALFGVERPAVRFEFLQGCNRAPVSGHVSCPFPPRFCSPVVSMPASPGCRKGNSHPADVRYWGRGGGSWLTVLPA